MKQDLNAFVIGDPSKCIGCRSCEVACAAVHREDNTGCTIGTMEAPITPRLYYVKDKDMVMTVQCRHCEDSPCVSSCPVKAIKVEEGGVYVDDKACIGCKTCALVCPVGAIGLQPKAEGYVVTGNVDRKVKLMAFKCDLCKEAGGTPNCIKACPKEALKLADPKEYKKDRNIKAVLELLEFNKKD